jgi:hypothetical protein
MEEILKNLMSPSWWLGVVLVGVTINLFSGYLQKRLARTTSNLTLRWRLKSKARRADRRQLVKRLRASDYEKVMAAADELRERTNSIYWAFLAAISFSVSPLSVITFMVSPNAPIHISDTGVTGRMLTALTIFLRAGGVWCLTMTHLHHIKSLDIGEALKIARSNDVEPESDLEVEDDVEPGEDGEQS